MKKRLYLSLITLLFIVALVMIGCNTVKEPAVVTTEAVIQEVVVTPTQKIDVESIESVNDIKTVTFEESDINFGDGQTFSMAVGDVNNDGLADICIANYKAESTVWFATQTGYTQSENVLSSPQQGAHGVALDDLDSDGDLDVFVANNNSSNAIYMNDGTGIFIKSDQSIGSETDYSVAVELADIDSDGDLDALISNYENSDQLWLNDGAGTFTLQDSEIGTISAYTSVFCDVDGDGDEDIYVSNIEEFDKILINDGAGNIKKIARHWGQTLHGDFQRFAILMQMVI